MTIAAMTIVKKIRNNSKRMSKLASIPSHFERRKKARAFVVAECAAQKLKLDETDISSATIAIAG